ncbi:unnamed protein product [Meganyctiphanes norvegica]|uniref:Uncharacterized protein n=1 Tax=Meganyctiphanes norvegica TaxID=48144 RepID=A0AAV2S958_MEGNR
MTPLNYTFIGLLVLMVFELKFSASFPRVVDECGPEYEWPLSYCVRYPVHWAAAAGDTGTIVSLLGRGLDVNLQDSNGWTALHYAAERGRADVVALLLREGAHIQVKDKFGRTPMKRAWEKGCKTLIKIGSYSKTCPLAPVDYESTMYYLQAAECSHYWDPQSWCNKYPLHWAAIAGHTGLVQSLLETGEYDVNQRDDLWGRTPLHRAAFTGRTEAVGLLIKFGADVYLNDKYSETPYSAAREKYCDIDSKHRLCKISPWNYRQTITLLKEGCSARNCTEPLSCVKNKCVLKI